MEGNILSMHKWNLFLLHGQGMWMPRLPEQLLSCIIHVGDVQQTMTTKCGH